MCTTPSVVCLSPQIIWEEQRTDGRQCLGHLLYYPPSSSWLARQNDVPAPQISISYLQHLILALYHYGNTCNICNSCFRPLLLYLSFNSCHLYHTVYTPCPAYPRLHSDRNTTLPTSVPAVGIVGAAAIWWVFFRLRD